MTEPFRVAVIGAGRIAQTYLGIFQANPDVEITAIADNQTEVAQAIAEAYGARPYSDHKELLAKESPEAVAICTPPTSHCPIALDCLDAGTHVLCEKPLSPNPSEVTQMFEAAGSNQLLLMMASKFRYVKDMISARAVIQAGILGTVVRFENTFASWLDVGQRWNSTPAISGGGVLIDNGSHAVDVVRYLLGPIESVLACHGPNVQDTPVEDSSHILFRCRSGVVGTIDLSWSIEKERPSYVEVFGTEGMLSVGWQTSRYRQNRSTNWVNFGSGYDKKAAFEAQIRNFIAVCHGEEQPLITPEDALSSVLTIEAAYTSAREQTWQQVRQV